MSEDPDNFQWKDGYTDQDGINLVMRIKNHMVDLAYERHPRSDQQPDIPLSYPLPSHFKVAYNGAWGPQIRELQ